MRKILRKLMALVERLQIVTVGKFDGHTFKVYNNIEAIPQARYKSFVNAFNEVNTCVSYSEALAYVKCIEDCTVNMERSRVHFYCQAFRSDLERREPMKMLLRSGTLLILVDDEDPEIIEDKYTQIKADLFDKSPEFAAFFVKLTYMMMRRYGIISDGFDESAIEDLMTYKGGEDFSSITGRHLYWGHLKTVSNG